MKIDQTNQIVSIAKNDTVLKLLEYLAIYIEKKNVEFKKDESAYLKFLELDVNVLVAFEAMKSIINRDNKEDLVSFINEVIIKMEAIEIKKENLNKIKNK